MKSFFKIIAYLLLTILVIAGGLILYVKTMLPDVGKAPDHKIEVTQELIARGSYLANSVNVCMDCHSTRDWGKFSGPLKQGTLGVGGEVFNQDFGFPGEYHSKNITPFALQNWTDGEIYRAITSGVNKDGKPLFPVMPYKKYGQMADEDVYAVIAYIRSLEPMESHPKKSSSDFPMNIIINTIPSPGNPQERPDKSDVLAYGAYLTNAAACGDCHTPMDKGNPIPGLEFAGGFEFKMPPFGIVRSANITPHPTSGIGNWSEEMFVLRFKTYADSSYVPHEVSESQFQTVMPWMMYSTMEEEDLKAIFAYLKTLKPIENKVRIFTSQKDL
ncbi:cytochrome c [Marinoscillum sp. MHG1-6]|uniref:c-type cytochrome n=1 Tax=Marinoscillum sp. MHG1-6 TaxID=2959627 RepID=UPI00215730E4|nr:cytochrome c [Marinoscillum sp. MHG1-6]